MTLSRTGYELHFEEIAAGCPQLGSASMVPWDTDTFGFPVAAYRVGNPELDPTEAPAFQGHFASWMEEHGAQLCSCVVPHARNSWRLYLSNVGFIVVDVTLQVKMNALSKARLPETRFELRPAKSEDHPAIEAIAEQSFAHGRYHADPLFPQRLADHRYSVWIRRALSGDESADRVFVLGQPGKILGFYHVAIDGDCADLRLAAVTPDLKGTMAGVDLYTATFRLLQNLGINRAVTSISSTNTGVMNVYSRLGCTFSNPEIVHHWHAPTFNKRATI